MPPVGREPGLGRALAGAAAASVATGPTLVLLGRIGDVITGSQAMGYWRTDDLGALIVDSSLFCLIGSVPAASVNAAVLSHLARRARDAVWWAMASGGVIGFLGAMIMNGLIPGLAEAPVALWLSATGTLMGLLHWAIAIRPRRRWRLSLWRDEEAIRAMK